MVGAFSTATILIATALLSSSSEAKASAPPPHPELGRATFETNFKQAQSHAKARGKPMFVLFDEVPGCSTVQAYGRDVLSHPLIVDAIETAFVPTFVKNNAGPQSPHTKVLKRYGEPAWNNPVGRVVDATGTPILPRLSGDYSLGATARYLVLGLKESGETIPPYLQLLADVETAKEQRTLERAQFSMYCFWSGEVGLGEVDGVVSTRPAHASAGEVVEVTFDRSKISYAELATRTRRNRVATTAIPLSNAQRDAALAAKLTVARASPLRDATSDDNYQLSRSPLRFLPMTDAQRTKVNAAVGRGTNPNVWLSPRQRALLSKIERFPSLQKNLEVSPPISALWDIEARIGAEALER